MSERLWTGPQVKWRGTPDSGWDPLAGRGLEVSGLIFVEPGLTSDRRTEGGPWVGSSPFLTDEPYRR